MIHPKLHKKRSRLAYVSIFDKNLNSSIMKHLTTILLLLSFNSCTQAQTKTIQAQLDEIVEDKIVIGVAAGYSVDGKIIEEVTAGYADKESEKHFKPPIQTYIPDYPKHKTTQITIRHLLSHTSGIAGYKDGNESNTITEYPTLYDALSLFKDRDLLFEPGTQYSYTTYGYTVLGAILEAVTEQTFEAYMQENIFEKAGMTNTGVKKYGIALENESKLYRRKNGRGKAKPAEENNLSNRIPGGGFYTTLTDMLKFGNAVIDHIFVKEETLTLMRQHHSLEKEKNAYGFGWFLYNPKPNEGAIIGHSGGQTGCTSFLFLVPEKKSVSIILANTSRAGSSIDPIAINLLHLSMK